MMKLTMYFKNPAVMVMLLLLVFCCINESYSQNSMTGDGFGGRSWYVAHNYSVGAYSAYTVCEPNNQLYGWGGNFFGELGDGTTISADTPVAAVGMTDVKFYTTGYISGVIKTNNTAWVFGYGDIANNGSSGFTSTPAQVLTDVRFIDAGSGHIVFVKNDGTVWGAGQNHSGQLGNGTISPVASPVTTPVQMTGISNAVRAVALGYGFPGASAGYFAPASMILLADSTVKLTGGYQWFSPNNNTIPVTVPGLSNIVDIKGSAVAAYALNSLGEVYSFGRESSSAQQAASLGLGPYTGLYTPPTKITFPASAAPIIALSANNDGYLAMALDENGNIFGWGANWYGQLGNGTGISPTTPVLIATNAIDIYAGESFSYILKADNTLWATGQSGWNIGVSGSIWMNLTNIARMTFTQIDPIISPMNLCAPVPVSIKLLSFNCAANGTSASLTWRSAEEINFDKYIIEYSRDGIGFREIARISSKGSNSNYKYVHHNVSGTAYYRLRMLDNDGTYAYSEIRSLRFNVSGRFTIAPNPAKEVIYIYSNSSENIKSVQVISVNGNVLKTMNNFDSGEPLNISGLIPGIYIIKTFYKNDKADYARFIKL